MSLSIWEFFVSAFVAPPRIQVPSNYSQSTSPQLDQSSSFFFHSSDSSSPAYVSTKLNGVNYHSWARSKRRVFGGKLKLEFFVTSLLLSHIHLIPCIMHGTSAICSCIHELLIQYLNQLHNPLCSWKMQLIFGLISRNAFLKDIWCISLDWCKKYMECKKTVSHLLIFTQTWRFYGKNLRFIF